MIPISHRLSAVVRIIDIDGKKIKLRIYARVSVAYHFKYLIVFQLTKNVSETPIRLTIEVLTESLLYMTSRTSRTGIERKRIGASESKVEIVSARAKLATLVFNLEFCTANKHDSPCPHI